MVSHHGGLSSGWFLSRWLYWGGLSSGWSFVKISSLKRKTALMRNHPDEAILTKDHPDERPPWCEMIVTNSPDVVILGWPGSKHQLTNSWQETTLTKDHPNERPSWQKITLMRDHPHERPPWWETILTKDHPDERPSSWKTSYQGVALRCSLIRGSTVQNIVWCFWQQVLRLFCERVTVLVMDLSSFREHWIEQLADWCANSLTCMKIWSTDWLAWKVLCLCIHMF